MSNAHAHPAFQSILNNISGAAKKSSKEFGDFFTVVQGIPCQVVIEDCVVVEGSFSYNAPSDWDYHGYTIIEFHLLDRKGYPARWIEAKMTAQEKADIEQLILNHQS